MKTILNVLKNNRHSNPAQKLCATAILLTVSLGMITTGAQAAPIVIQDTYIGGTATVSSYNNQDVIGELKYFDVSKMEVSFLANNTLRVDIYSQYFNNIGQYNTQLGDLFLSTDGYRGEGEQWEYALKLDSYLPTTSSGRIDLYSVQTANIVNSSALPGYIYRKDQEVQYNPTGQSALTTGSWELYNIGGPLDPDTDDFLRFTITYRDFGDVSTYGLHWGMTCGNDVIEGAAPVPEPSAMLLFGTGLMGLGGILRRKMQTNNDIRMK